MKMRDPPITSKAVITGRADAEITCASLSQPLLKPSPAEIKQYSRTILDADRNSKADVSFCIRSRPSTTTKAEKNEAD